MNGLEFIEIKTKPCKPEDFNWGTDLDTKSKFFPVNPVSLKDLQTYSPKMKCIDEKDIEIMGNFDSDKASNLMIVFELCDKNKRSCASDEAIAKWLEFRYIYVLENEKLFV